MKVYVSPSSQTENVGAGDYGTEAQRMQQLSDLLVPKLKAAGFTVYGGDNSLTLTERIAQSNSVGANIHIALHSNAFNGTARGIETYYYTSSANGNRLAGYVQSKLCAIANAPSNRGIKASDTLAELKNTTGVAALTEVGFHDNATDAAWIVSHLTQIATAICDAIKQY